MKIFLGEQVEKEPAALKTVRTKKASFILTSIQER